MPSTTIDLLSLLPVTSHQWSILAGWFILAVVLLCLIVFLLVWSVYCLPLLMSLRDMMGHRFTVVEQSILDIQKVLQCETVVSQFNSTSASDRYTVTLTASPTTYVLYSRQRTSGYHIGQTSSLTDGIQLCKPGHYMVNISLALVSAAAGEFLLPILLEINGRVSASHIFQDYLQSQDAQDISPFNATAQIAIAAPSRLRIVGAGGVSPATVSVVSWTLSAACIPCLGCVRCCFIKSASSTEDNDESECVTVGILTGL